ncbi:retrotransposon protein [Cucumis melo var. makuwa]|uniref:Retrotransposon protein n=1 Tax=Cucumis melo var. makuwa TaxID=1194695 RepID=A0A5A7SZM4_CUCMM|nr:retrotransposon protein [Cucumis melo var. makuwa]TYK03361.1 retrotransposon protein [Cucumis melo var. makuwa]
MLEVFRGGHSRSGLYVTYQYVPLMYARLFKPTELPWGIGRDIHKGQCALSRLPYVQNAKDPQQTRGFYGMPLHDKIDYKCQRYYHLCDTGFLNAEGFVTPYKGQRYHLQEWHGAGNAPTTAKEYFNMKYASNFAYATTAAAEDIQYTETTNKWSQWRDELAELHHVVNRLLNKLFPYYNELAYAYGCDRMTSCFVETFVDVGSNEPAGYEGFDMSDGNEEFLSMYSQRIDISQDDVRASRPARTSDDRVETSGSKRKRGS